MSHDTLMNYYHLNAQLHRYHHYSITELEEMFPFEREAYVILLRQQLIEEAELAKQTRAAQKA